LCAAFFYAGILVRRISTHKLFLFEKHSIKSFAVGAAIFVLIASFAFVSRGSKTVENTEDLREVLMPRFASYSCGHLYAFSDWFASTNGMHSQLIYPHQPVSYGFYTFMAPFRWLGAHREIPGGIFDQYFFYGDLLTGNIYTMFRGLIQDFGIIGSIAFMLAAGFLLHWAFQRMLHERWPVFTVAVFVVMLGYIYMSFVVSLLVWNRIYVTFVLLWAFLQVNKLILQTDGHRLAMPGMASEVPARP
jgi:oligosaccharide repeat unit polymerase